METEEKKICRRCKKTYPKTREYFYTYKRPSGLKWQNTCKSCNKILQQKRNKPGYIAKRRKRRRKDTPREERLLRHIYAIERRIGLADIEIAQRGKELTKIKKIFLACKIHLPDDRREELRGIFDEFNGRNSAEYRPELWESLAWLSNELGWEKRGKKDGA